MKPFCYPDDEPTTILPESPATRTVFYFGGKWGSDDFIACPECGTIIVSDQPCYKCGETRHIVTSITTGKPVYSGKAGIK